MILESLNLHYNESFNNHQKTINKRDKSLLITMIMTLFIIVEIFDSDFFALLSKAYIEDKAGLKINDYLEIFPLLVWLIFTVSIIKYCQLVLQCDDQITYLKLKEKQLNDLCMVNSDNSTITPELFSRESGHYKSTSKLFKRYLRVLFRVIVPISWMLTIIYYLYINWRVLTLTLDIENIAILVFTFLALITIVAYCLEMITD